MRNQEAIFKSYYSIMEYEKPCVVIQIRSTCYEYSKMLLQELGAYYYYNQEINNGQCPRHSQRCRDISSAKFQTSLIEFV